MQADVNSILDLDFRRANVCIKLFQTILRDDPELAATWRDLHRDYMTARYPHRAPVLTPLDLVRDSIALLLPHPRYDYVAEWLDEWRETSLSLRDDIYREHGLTTRELDAVLNAELARRRDRDGREA
ncbi:hypothetical protein HFN68_02645 [Rhizobium laguerreae]|uniref:hypothetical protein n=1 Tax=Rhizobium laguerreae TaxID=1076926 RepID=UPI001C8FED46|nr:hypothetical protein [Rhizobium laguerreae]MBY3531847.1 hypothetical protein [Rhizobium laguerreae]